MQGPTTLSARKLAFLSTALVASLLVLQSVVGCGGKASDPGTVAPPFQGTVSVSATTVNPGDPVTVTWSYSGGPPAITNIATNSIAATASGSYTVHPITDQTWYFNGGYQNGSQNPSVTSVSVTVNPSAQRYVVVGDASNQDLQGVVPLLAHLTKVQPVVTMALPSDPSSFDAILIDATAQVAPTDVARIRSYLQAGKGVILDGLVPRLLATGDRTNTDISAIDSWFGGGPTLSDAFGTTTVLPGKFVPVPSALANDHYLDLQNWKDPEPNFILVTADVWRPDAGTDPVAGQNAPFNGDPNDYFVMAFGYRTPIGGRIYYQCSVDTWFGDPLLFLAAARWAATGP